MNTDSSLIDGNSLRTITGDVALDMRYPRYRAEVDLFGSEEWDEIVGLFDDGPIQQTATFASVCWGKQLSRLALYEGDEVVAAAQVVIVEMPLLGAGVAHCKFGPMWRRKNSPVRSEIYREILAAMRAEYAVKRGLLLRIKPWEVIDEGGQLASIRGEIGLEPQDHLPRYSTFILDMSRSTEELRKGFLQKWRYNLRKAEKQDLQVTCSRDKQAAEIFMQLHFEMRDIKTYVDTSEVESLPELIEGLPEHLRPAIFIAYHNGKPISSLVISLIGRTAYCLFAASGADGRRLSASYVLFWEAMHWVKDYGCDWFDLVGSMPAGTGGHLGYRQFKAGMTGRNGKEYFMCDWQVCHNWRSHLMVHGGAFVSARIRAARHHLNSLKVRLSRHPAGTRRCA